MYVKERFRLDEYTEELLQDMEPPFGYNGFGEFIFYRTYSRNIDGHQENWADCVIRVINGIMSIRKDWYIKNRISWNNKYWLQYARELAVSAFKMEWLPPGRGLWACGTDFIYERGGMALYNCSFTNINFNDLSEDINWLMDSLMLGCGVGFSPLREEGYIFKSPKGSYEYIIADSREGWTQSVKEFIEAYMYGTSKPQFIYDEIREAGLPIKGFGGISSGPKPLKELHIQIEEIIEKYMTDKYYDSVILKTDIANLIGCCVIAGNVRRSAELALLDINDPVFKDLKDYNKYPEREAYGYMSNNSITLKKAKDFERLGEIADRVIERGEPGYLNLKNFKYGRIGKKDKVRKDEATGVNPCLPGWSKVLTKEGIRELNKINIGDKIWSEYGWTTVINKWSTNINKIYKYITTAGTLYCTENHQIISEGQKIEVQYAELIDILNGPINNKIIEINNQDVMDGLIIGDGEIRQGTIILNIGDDDHDYFNELNSYIIKNYDSPKRYKISTTLYNEEIPRTFDREIPIRFIEGNIHKICSFLRGLYSANGSVSYNRITLSATSFKIIEAVQIMLSSIGISSNYGIIKAKTKQFKNGIYDCKENYNLSIAAKKDRELFQEKIGFIQNYKTDKLHNLNNSLKGKKAKRIYSIISSELISEEETFDITVDQPYHTFWCNGFNISNCGEIPLQHREVCNIDETFPTVCNDPNTWYKACEHATFYSSTVSLLPTHQPSTNRVVARNRRIGVSIVDFTGWIENEGVSKVTKFLRKGYQIVRKTNQLINGEAGIPESIRVTTVKPGGTIPKLAGKTSGAGYPNFDYMLRRVRVQRNSPIWKILVEANVPFEADFFSKNTDVFEWPLNCGPAPPCEEISLWQQAMNLVLLQREWADNAVSNTLNFRPKWKLIKIFSIYLGCDNPFKDAHKWLDTNIGYIGEDAYNFFMDTLHVPVPHVFSSKFMMKIKFDEDLTYSEIKFFEFDPTHEEDSIEPVLASIAPLTKTVSLLPHSPKGAYLQMPEQGITKEEYERRLSTIKKIDWSLLNNSDGMDERYCQGNTCEIIPF